MSSQLKPTKREKKATWNSLFISRAHHLAYMDCRCQRSTGWKEISIHHILFIFYRYRYTETVSNE
ncbi:hypothetical protein L249_2617 [Ophiocordyceps polyrhachis-furcata BCC 54312]|uniref:Uncharacterized protein n=1 Tax=Ophiocordyceps polyrhachis-furcata BCC 54312 TaxID=1330021 RepID=A0A367LS88_9HYPO|nr:hypothetical protein L249_2617 [Ophiocordyceps polyrhachis-furcata BCC 54312]